MTNFHEVSFPLRIAYGSTGGPERRTEIVELADGFEERNSPWANSRRSYNAASGIKSPDDAADVIAFFEARKAQLYGFRFKDRADYKSCAPSATTSMLDQTLGTGNGVTTAFQLVKLYSDNAGSWTRTIKKPIVGTLKVSVDGSLKALTTDYTVDLTTGIITFLVAPANTKLVKAGFEFEVPVRFDTDKLNMNLSNWEAMDLGNIPLLEVKV